MTWVRFDDTWVESESVQHVGPLAAWMHVCALSYSNRLLTDGRIPASMVRRLCDVGDLDPEALAEQLVAEGMWARTEGGYQLVDALDLQPTAAKVLTDREKKTKRQARWRAGLKERDGTVDAPTEASRDAHVDRAPNPTRPAPKEGGSGPSRDATSVDVGVGASTQHICEHGRRLVGARDGSSSCPDCDTAAVAS